MWHKELAGSTKLTSSLDIRAGRGGLVLRLAADRGDIAACQRLRYRVFYEELAAKPSPEAAASRMDKDRYDDICDHILVVNTAAAGQAEPVMVSDGELVGTYRLLRQEVAQANAGFYTQYEFDIAPLIGRHPDLRFLELGRSCVLKQYRTKPVVELLWQGIWNYVRAYDLQVMFGCASLEGVDPDQHRVALSFLAHFAQAPAEWQVRALADRFVDMDRIPKDGIDHKQALRSLPPLIKGYLRLGCYIGNGAVIDRQFNTIDVLIVLPVSAINERYFSHFGQPND